MGSESLVVEARPNEPAPEAPPPVAERPHSFGLRPFVELARLPAALTAPANVAAGWFVASGATLSPALAAGAASGLLLYAGGVTFNDVFDRDLDRDERPLRPLPSGRVGVREAALFGAALNAGALALAAAAGPAALAVAVAIVVFSLAYDAHGKRHPLLGPLNMGVLRGLSFALGLALVPGALALSSPLALVYVAFIAGVTVVSTGETGGVGPRRYVAGALLAALGFVLLGVFLRNAPLLRDALPFAAAFVLVPGAAFIRLARDPRPSRVHATVKASVLSLALLDASLAAAVAGIPAGVAIALVAPVAWVIARAVPVT